MKIPALPKPIVRLLRSEALAIGIIALITYFRFGFTWLPLILCIFLPDLFMVGYARNSKLGATLYNIGHTYLTPAAVLALWIFTGRPSSLLAIALIWIIHIAFDRSLGYGLKFDTGFTHTHLGKIGPDRDS